MKKEVLLFLLLFIFSISIIQSEISSDNYKVSTIVVGSGGDNSSSSNYESNTVVENTVGSTSSSSYNTHLGFWQANANLNSLPEILSALLNSSSGTNKTTENLSVWFSGVTDSDGDAVTNITDWRKNGQSIVVLNMPFDKSVGTTASGAIRDYSGYGNNGTLVGGGELIWNGGAETGDKTNFESFEGVTTDDSHSGTYAFYEEGQGQYSGAEYVEIDLVKTYTLSGWFKSYGSGGDSRLYYGFVPYDENKVQIQNYNINIVANTETTLYEDVASTDSIVKIVDGTNWYTLSHGRMAFNIDDSGNYNDLPNRDVSNPNIVRVENMGSYWEIEFSTTVGKTYPAGTKVRMHTSGGTYMYSAAGGALVPSSWTEYTADIQGESLYGPTNTQWWRGTRYVRLLFLNNYAQDSTYKLYADDFSFTSDPITYDMPDFIEGKVGGAYEFDGIDDYISFDDTTSLDVLTNTISVAFWMNPKSDAVFSDTGLVVKGSMVYGCTFHTNDVWCYLNGGGNSAHAYNLNPDTWYHIVQTYDGSNIKVYKNGALSESVDYASGAIQNGGALQIGKYSNYFNGTIDEVLIFNYTLSAEQINALYLDGVAGHQMETLVSNETTKGDTWQVAVTPNDGKIDGSTVLSNSLTVENSLPTVTLDTPADEGLTTDRTPVFTWTGHDSDGDTLEYELNLTLIPSSLCTDPDRSATGINEESYTVPTYLNCLFDNGDYYNWSVRASDDGGVTYGPWSETRRIYINSDIEISLPVDVVDFGSMLTGTNNTTDDNPAPFELQNDGNCMVNVSINATNLWTSQSNPSDYFQYKIANKSGEEGSFYWAQSKISWNNVPSSNQLAISQLNWSDANDISEVDINITVPYDEVAGTKTSNVYFTASLGE